MKPVRTLWYAFLYYTSWLLFGAVGLLLNLLLAPALLWPRRERLGRITRRAIRSLFSLWLKWLHACGVVRVRWHGFDDSSLVPQTIYVANHPTLVDATFLLARLPDPVCIFKPTLLRNPVIAPAALLAQYIAGEQGVDTLRSAAERVRQGRALLIFPEGTRTDPGCALNPLRPGFALIARRAPAPIRIIRLVASPDLARRGRAWWRLPSLPGWVDIHCDERIVDAASQDTARLVAQVEHRLRAAAES